MAPWRCTKAQGLGIFPSQCALALVEELTYVIPVLLFGKHLLCSFSCHQVAASRAVLGRGRIAGAKGSGPPVFWDIDAR